jgi:hypothetical protein
LRVWKSPEHDQSTVGVTGNNVLELSQLHTDGGSFFLHLLSSTERTTCVRDCCELWVMIVCNINAGTPRRGPSSCGDGWHVATWQHSNFLVSNGNTGTQKLCLSSASAHLLMLRTVGRLNAMFELGVGHQTFCTMHF